MIVVPEYMSLKLSDVVEAWVKGKVNILYPGKINGFKVWAIDGGNDKRVVLMRLRRLGI